MADATMDPMPMEGEMKMDEHHAMEAESHGPPALQANVQFFFAAFL